jgi:hypothetical protein
VRQNSLSLRHQTTPAVFSVTPRSCSPRARLTGFSSARLSPLTVAPAPHAAYDPFRVEGL